MDQTQQTVVINLMGAVLAGGLIGLERSYHARPAGFRTHTLVCLASSLLMIVDLFQWIWMQHAPMDSIRTDPTRMAQGIMTGIGFLGAGVIFKEGVTVRGLTTAASIWITAAIGILFGIGFYFPAILSTVIALIVLSTFRWVEAKLPSQSYAHLHVGFDRNVALSESDVKGLLMQHGFKVSNVNYRMDDTSNHLEYRMIIKTARPENKTTLVETLKSLPIVKSFRLSPTGD